MKDNVEDIVSSLSINHILMAILEEKGSISVPALKFLDIKSDNKELVVDYDEDGPSFKFSLRDNNE